MKLTPEEMQQRIEAVEKTNSAILSLLRKVLDPEGKLALNIAAEDLEVFVTIQKQQMTKDFDTSSMNGKIMFCAIEDMKNQPFTESEIGKCLSERAWPNSRGAIAPTLSKMLGANLLIRENGSSPAKYRIPGKITVRTKEV
jgi:hypothetical protein